jgi:hypothetical protein
MPGECSLQIVILDPTVAELSQVARLAHVALEHPGFGFHRAHAVRCAAHPPGMLIRFSAGS